MDNHRFQDLSEWVQSEALTLTSLADGSGVLLDLTGNQVFALNPTGFMIVEAMRDGIGSAEELVSTLCEKFGIEQATAVNDVRVFLDELEQLKTHPS